MGSKLEFFIRKIPKAELHVHIEGTLEPKLIFKIAKRNNISLNYKSVFEIQKAYNFSGLQSFLDIYYETLKVLQKECDFYDMTWAFVEKLKVQNVKHVEIFFDPQAHISRGINFDTVVMGIHKALEDGKRKYDISFRLIMCFLRHLSSDSAFEVLEESVQFCNLISAVGLDSTELGNPPSKFSGVFKKARELGYKTVAHAGEEGPPEYIWQAIEDLQVSRVDHGVRCIEDKLLVKELVKKQIPLTVCPQSNVKLGVFKDLKDHSLKRLLDLGLKITINSDDPAYFGGYVCENFIESHKSLVLNHKDIYKLAKNSFEASFLSDDEIDKHLGRLNDFMLGQVLSSDTAY